MTKAKYIKINATNAVNTLKSEHMAKMRQKEDLGRCVPWSTPVCLEVANLSYGIFVYSAFRFSNFMQNH